VRVEVTIDRNGQVATAKALGGHPLLIPAAVEAAKKWRYEPGPGDDTSVIEFKFSPAY
jgi:TonB family protein